jgi:hypothetical protein
VEDDPSKLSPHNNFASCFLRPETLLSPCRTTRPLYCETIQVVELSTQLCVVLLILAKTLTTTSGQSGRLTALTASEQILISCMPMAENVRPRCEVHRLVASWREMQMKTKTLSNQLPRCPALGSKRSSGRRKRNNNVSRVFGQITRRAASRVRSLGHMPVTDTDDGSRSAYQSSQISLLCRSGA